MSLIETCVSVAIISTVTMMAVPSLIQTRDDYVLKSVANDVASKMHLARIRAVSRNVDCRLRVTSTATYAIECQDPGWVVIDSAVLPRGFALSANARPEFHRLGNVSPTGTVTVSNANGRSKKIIVNNGGRIRID